MGVFTLFLRRPHAEPELVDAACSRLAAVPGLLDAGQANLDADLAPRLFVQRAIGQAAAGVRYVRELLPADVADDGLRAKLVEAAEPAAEAFDRFGTFLTDLLERASGDAAIGAERYSALLEESELLGYGAATLHDRGRSVWADLDAEMRELAEQIDPSASGWREVVEAINQEHPASPEEMLAGYRDWTARLPRVPRRARARDVRRRRGVRSGAVAGVPAAGARGGVVLPAAGVQAVAARAVQRSIPARRRER